MQNAIMKKVTMPKLIAIVGIVTFEIRRSGQSVIVLYHSGLF